MKRFAITYDDTIIGHSALENADPPMGVAFGTFIPNAKFAEIRKTERFLDEAEHRIWNGFDLILPSGETLKNCAGVAIAEYGPEDTPFALEVTCLGIPYPKYTELFPHHVAAYEAQFPPA